MNTAISFIIPVYNAKEFLRESIESVISQKGFEKCELILVDDGSTDVSSAICSMYAERFSNVICYRQENSGVSAARNKGIELASGKYVSFVDSDDFLFKGMLNKVLCAIEKSDSDMVFFDFIHEYADFNNFLKFPFPQEKLLDKNYIQNDIVDYMLENSAMNSVWNKVFRKSIIDDNSIKFNAGQKFGEDKAFVLDFLSVCSNAYYVPENGYFYRYVQSGAIHSDRSDYFYTLMQDYYDTIKMYGKFQLDEKYVEKKYKKRFANQFSGCVVLAYKSCSKSSFKKTMCSSFSDEKIYNFVKELKDGGCFESETDVFISNCFLKKNIGRIIRKLRNNELKTEVYSFLHKSSANETKKEKITLEYEEPERLEYPFKVTVFTPFYNRRRTIDRVFNSLVSQTYQDFEWLIIDDGSKEDISDLLEEYRSKAGFPIRYYYKKNGGKHTAANYANYLTDSEYIIILDSDDAMPPETIKYFLNRWDSIPDDRKDEYWSVVGRCIDSVTKEPKSPPFPDGINESENPREIAATCPGEKFSCIKTAKLKEFPFPEPEGTNFITECVVWNKLDKKYKQFYTNDIVRYYYENEPDSLMTSWYKNHIKEGYVTNYYWMMSVLNDGCGEDKAENTLKMGYYGNVIGKSIKEVVADIESPMCKLLCIIEYPFLSVIKKVRYKKYVD